MAISDSVSKSHPTAAKLCSYVIIINTAQVFTAINMHCIHPSSLQRHTKYNPNFNMIE